MRRSRSSIGALAKRNDAPAPLEIRPTDCSRQLGNRMRRRDFITLFGAAAACFGLADDLRARPDRVYRIGVLETIAAAQNAANLAGLLRGLRERGYVEGQNLQIEYRSADGRAERFPDLAAEMVRLPVDLIVTRGTPAAKAAKAATETVPIVMGQLANRSVSESWRICRARAVISPASVRL
jgi:ABC-type uncharacterized transport system substrate-binding protein